MTYEEARDKCISVVDFESGINNGNELERLVIQALDKQIAKKPKKETVQVNGYDHGCDDYSYTNELCPSCNLPILRVSYCHHCGQKILW